MRIWRICKAKHASTALSGLGAEKTGGRWNQRGDKMVYTSTTLSLASLELFVHLEPHLVPNDLVSVEVELPETVSSELLNLADLPKNWRDYPAPLTTQDMGSRWLSEQRSAVLIVPSAVNPEELNLLLNPRHPEMSKIKVIGAKPFHYDPRMWKT